MQICFPRRFNAVFNEMRSLVLHSENDADDGHSYLSIVVDNRNDLLIDSNLESSATKKDLHSSSSTIGEISCN
ncbi:unnamed protein product [Brugia pahangi]|uniref:Uncharacterized protein n=1 Tax=Brugia pahangi TaxID=6280 RepID=A0A0N4T5C3_BRUPA|nr:unnamed protein product [Brugia pahangi]